MGTDANDQDWTRGQAGSAALGGDGASRPDGAHGGPVGAASTPELIGRLINDLNALVEKQIELAKEELSEHRDEALAGARQLGLGAGVLLLAGFLILIWLWTAFIWAFNWLGWKLLGADWLGWPLGLLVPALVAYVGYAQFIRPAIQHFRTIFQQPLGRTRATFKETLAWLQTLRTPNGR